MYLTLVVEVPTAPPTASPTALPTMLLTSDPTSLPTAVHSPSPTPVSPDAEASVALNGETVVPLAHLGTLRAVVSGSLVCNLGTNDISSVS